DTGFLRFVIPLVLVFIGIYFLFAGKLLETHTHARTSEPVYRNIVVPAIGGYDGMFGPGTGSFFALSGVALQGRTLLEATAVAKTLNFATNIASLCVFFIAGQIAWTTGLVMMAGQAAGAWLGSHVLFRINPQYLRVAIVIICMAMLARYFMT
ncbi:MAG: TSUP family transporter, partial [Pseudomonadota bacterium]|nr:TSUP family transporter [Pseudomonadota bacterium]